MYSLRYFQKGFNYSQDGPGNRLIYHLQGCNLRCPWCANPEGIPWSPPLMQMEPVLPAMLCPKGAIQGNGSLDRSICKGCRDMECQKQYRNRMLVCQMKEEPVEQILNEILSCEPMFMDGGGVTFSGGEVGLQMDAVLSLCEMLREEGIHIAVETNLTHPRTRELAEHVDYFLCDYKHYDADILHRETGGDLRQIHQHLEEVLHIPDLPVVIRIPLVQYFNGKPEHIKGFVETFRHLRSIRGELQVELLSYHEYGKVKWQQCGLEYPEFNGYVNQELVKQYEEAFRRIGIQIIHT